MHLPTKLELHTAIDASIDLRTPVLVSEYHHKRIKITAVIDYRNQMLCIRITISDHHDQHTLYIFE